MDWKRTPALPIASTISSGAGQSVKFPNDDDVALTKLAKYPVQFWPIAVGSRGLLAKNALAASLTQSFELKILTTGGCEGVQVRMRALGAG
jgi:hypothetical protein